ncbi:hypothetical protein [Micromonospora sp. NBS 11-29]|uniref:hypothetical protein n=1 Tax=Micromonospora sp. NBS 11-29 TaxID=1960879 RepID=UPI0020CCAD2B|nr:hypothetical protein [Micromonospora sp. NBS 11-29]
MPLIAGVVVYERPRPLFSALNASGWAWRFSLVAQLLRFQIREDHQSLVGIAPAGASGVAKILGLVLIAPQPLGRTAPGGRVSV